MERLPFGFSFALLMLDDHSPLVEFDTSGYRKQALQRYTIHITPTISFLYQFVRPKQHHDLFVVRKHGL